jgi:hypothetical protein
MASISIEIPLLISPVFDASRDTHNTGKLPTSNAARAGLGFGIISAYTSFIAVMSRMSASQRKAG